MTKEEVIQNMDDRFAGKPVIGVYELIDRIYDDFESQTCDNCKHSIKEAKKFSDVLFCGYALKFAQVKKDFGCNEFKSK